jgi:hypothetical protein
MSRLKIHHHPATIVPLSSHLYVQRGRCGRDRMVVGYTTTYVIILLSFVSFNENISYYLRNLITPLVSSNSSYKITLLTDFKSNRTWTQFYTIYTLWQTKTKFYDINTLNLVLWHIGLCMHESVTLTCGVYERFVTSVSLLKKWFATHAILYFRQPPLEPRVDNTNLLIMRTN